MQRKNLLEIHGLRWARAASILLLCVGAAPAAFAYGATVTSEANSLIYVDFAVSPQYSKKCDLDTVSTTLNIPVETSCDTSLSTDAGELQDVQTLGAYNAWVEPGGLHLLSRSLVYLNFVAAAPGADRRLAAMDNGGVTASLTDDVTFNVAGLAAGTPLLIDVGLRVDGDFAASGGAGPQPYPSAYASGYGSWGFELFVPSGRPAGVPLNLSNRFDGHGYFGVRQDGSIFNEFSQYGYPQLVAVTMFAVNGQPATIQIFASVNTGAFGDATGAAPTYDGLVEANVRGSLENTVGWGGITGARLVDDTPVALADLSVVSSSGFDYTKEYVSTVPEPSLALQSFVAIGCCSWLARRRVARGSAGAA